MKNLINYNKAEISLFALFIIIHLIPIWYLEYFHTQDGPVTVYNARILYSLIFDINWDVYSHYYQLNVVPSPNWLSSIILTSLMTISDSNTAHKILISLYILSFPIAFRFFIVSINPANRIFSLFSFPLIYSYFLFFGFYNFLFGIVLMLFFLGYCIRLKGKLGRKEKIIISLFLLAIYVTHAVAYVLSITTITIIYYLQSQGSIKLHNLKTFNYWKIEIKKLLPLIYLFIPTLLLFSLYFLNSHTSVGFHRESVLDHITYLVGFKTLITFDKIETIFVIAFAFVIYGLVISQLINSKLTRKSWQLENNWMLILVLFILLTFIFSPNRMGGGSILKYRIPLIVYIFTIGWLAQTVTGKRKIAITSVIAAVISICLILVRLPVLQAISNDIMNYISVSAPVNQNSTVLPITLNRNGNKKNGTELSPNLNIYKNIGSYVGYRKDLIILDNYQARTTYFPIIWKEDLNPFIHISKNRDPNRKSRNIESHPPCIDFCDYSERTSGSVDYVLIYGDRDEFTSNDCQMSTDTQLSSCFEIIKSTMQTELFIRSN